jgi:hypothetical protein
VPFVCDRRSAMVDIPFVDDRDRVIPTGLLTAGLGDWWVSVDSFFCYRWKGRSALWNGFDPFDVVEGSSVLEKIEKPGGWSQET